MGRTVRSMGARELGDLVSGADRGSVIVVDVRDSDYAGGHIRGSVNVPKDELKDTGVGKWADEWGKAKTLVFHCMFSQVRGPYCARLAARHFDEAGKEGCGPEVCILENGFQGFLAEMRSRPALFEEMDEGTWGPLG